MGRIFILRHGQTTANRDEVIQGPRIDASLSDLGHRQADSLGTAMATKPLAALYSSPLARARQTATSVVQRHPGGHLAVQVVPELYEMDYGDFAGRSYSDVHDEMAQILDAWRMGFVDQAFPGGESAILAQHRIRPFALRLRGEARDHDVAVVAHGRINRVLIATLTGAGLSRLEEFPQSNASITELDVGADGVMLARLNDTSHLSLKTDAFS